MSDSFEVTWEADDGYVGGSRPHTFNIDDDEIDTDASEDELESLFWDSIQNDFEGKVTPYSDDWLEFLDWAQKIQKQRGDE